KLLEFATGLIDTVVEGIRNWVVTTIVRAAITKLVTMFNPVGAVIQGIITIYNTIAFFIERAKQIAALAEAIFDSIVNIANGNIGAATDHVEKAMARTLPVIISFLARLIGLGGISSEIKKIIQKIQSVIDNAINKVVNFIVDRAKGLIAKMTGKSTEAGKADTRTREAKEKDVKDAVRAVKESATSPGATIETVQQQLPKLKEIYRLNVLTVVPKSGSSFHIHAEVNPTGDEDVTIGGSKEPSAKIVGPLVVLQVTVMGRNYELKQSIQRHHYLWLDNADSEEINSIMFYNLPFDQIVKDSIELGKQIQTKLAKSQKAQVEGKYQVGERSYVVDNVEHFYVVQGKLVWGGVSKEEWLATRSIRKIHRGVKDDQGRLITYSTIRRMIARRRVRPDAQEAIRFIPRPNIVNAAVIAFKAAPSSDRKIIEASGQEQLALAIRFLVQND
ncbi:MAG TPA: hypothetical protein VFA10_09655, partial [Ktedonobacteraceae bacterium]|nr:hypothetical protein [Ktedonobacteraceae bacterium]